MADPGLIATLSSLLAPLPGVEQKQLPTHITFTAGKKVFAFTRSSGSRVALKLPKERIAALLQRDDIVLLTMGKRTMKEWIVIEHEKPADYKKDLALFKEAKAFVETKKKK
ncbi:MAG: hypothetical protein ACRD3K_09405 [Edaphobacter sp.]